MQNKDTAYTETIAAIATASGAGGIGVVRVSGSLCQSIASQILGHCPTTRYAAYLPFYDAQQTLIHRGIAIFYANPNSYTGEDVLELQAHGGTALMQIVLARCIALGARQAEPGAPTHAVRNNLPSVNEDRSFLDPPPAAFWGARLARRRSVGRPRLREWKISASRVSEKAAA